MKEPTHIVVVNHGRFGEELIRSAELIVGKIDHIHAVSLLPGMSIEEYYGLMKDTLQQLDGDILVLADLYGGTPSNVAMMMQREFHVHVLCGVNLAMLIELVMKRAHEDTKDVETIIRDVLESARGAILEPKQIEVEDEEG